MAYACRCWSITLLLTLASSPLCAQVSGTLSAWSDQRYRGVSLSNGRGQLQLSLNYDAPNGYYLSGLLAATPAADADSVAVLNAGRLWSISTDKGYALELGGSYTHHGAYSGADYAEAYVGLVANRMNARLYYAPRYLGWSNGSLYLELEGSLPLGHDNRWSLTQHIGWLHGGAGRSGGDRTDVKLGFNLHLSEGDLSLAWLYYWPSRPPIPQESAAAQRRSTLVLGFVRAF
jgi:uncharacterized protein (TIGR02001 family)